MPADPNQKAIADLDKRLAQVERALKGVLAVQKAQDNHADAKKNQEETAKHVAELSTQFKHDLSVWRLGSVEDHKRFTAREAEWNAKLDSRIKSNRDEAAAKVKSTEDELKKLTAQTEQSQAALQKQTERLAKQEAATAKQEHELAIQAGKEAQLEARLKGLEGMLHGAMQMIQNLQTKH